MNEQIRELIKQAGGEFWQRIESDGVLNKEAYITFDPPQSLEKFAELIVRECADVLVAEMNRLDGLDRFVAAQTMDTAQVLIKQHFGVE